MVRMPGLRAPRIGFAKNPGCGPCGCWKYWLVICCRSVCWVRPCLAGCCGLRCPSTPCVLGVWRNCAKRSGKAAFGGCEPWPALCAGRDSYGWKEIWFDCAWCLLC